ncbi:MAG: hypothetical protein D6790_17095 [Caldilineae bacterium]|nr:MAG: hypothetical protein D6790_17095 [Caldilineae bacterium]
MVQLRSEQHLPPGAPLIAEGRTVGAVTSSAYSPAQGTHLALAIVKRPHNQPGSQLETESGATATVVRAW